MLKWLKRPWPYWVGGILLGVFNVILLAVNGTPWHVTSGFLTCGIGILDLLGIKAYEWQYFKILSDTYGDIILKHSFFINNYNILNIAVIVGALTATLLSSQFTLKKLKEKKQIILCFAGGILMGYGSRLTAGCNIGSFFSGIPSFSLHAWVYWVFIVLGAIVGIKILSKYLN